MCVCALPSPLSPPRPARSPALLPARPPAYRLRFPPSNALPLTQPARSPLHPPPPLATPPQPGDFNCGCKMGEQGDGCTTPGNCSSGACVPCPETAGSDCSRCANPPPDMPGYGRLMFEPPCDKECLQQRPSVLDVVKVPDVKPGKYVVGFRYDCDATAQVWSNCADITIE